MEISIKEKLKETMKQRNVTQIKLAKELKVSQATIAAYCTGRKIPNIERLVQICIYLNISTDYLLGINLNTEEQDFSPEEE